MKAYILFVLIIHTTTATVDLLTLKDTAATKLQTFHENAATNLQNLQQQAAMKLHTIQEKATESFQQLADSIDFKKLDILNILPKLRYKSRVIKETVKNLPEYKQKVRFYLQRIKSLTGQDVLMAFDAGVPWPAKRMDDEVYAVEF